VGKTKNDRRFSFTKRAIEALPAPAAKRATYYDAQVRGLGVLVQPTGHRAFFWFRKVQGYPKWRTIGRFPDLSVEQARARASEFNASVARWKAANYEGPAPLERQRALALGVVLEDYLERHLKANAKNPDRAMKGARWMVDRYVPVWKSRKLGSIRREHVRDLHAQVGEKHGKVTANRLVQLLRALFNWSISVELWHGENPARGITPFHEASRTRFVQPEELPRLFKALSRERNLDLRDFVLLALFTGARRSNVLAMRWDQLDLRHGLWTIPEPKNNVPYTVPLIDEATAVLKERRRRIDGEWVFPSSSASGHVTDVKRAWRQLLERAKITGLRIHDLRRSLGSWQAGLGVSLPIIGKSLGHQSSDATEVYARLHLDPVRAAIREAASAMLTAGKTNKQQLLGAAHG